MAEVGNIVHGEDATGRIKIDKIVYESIITCVGYPLMEPSDMGISDEDVKRLTSGKLWKNSGQDSLFRYQKNFQQQGLLKFPIQMTTLLV